MAWQLPRRDCRPRISCEVWRPEGPLVYEKKPRRDLAAQNPLHFLFESPVLDGAPVFSLFRETLPAARLLGFRGVLNSTTNFILGELEAGKDLEDAVRRE